MPTLRRLSAIKGAVVRSLEVGPLSCNCILIGDERSREAIVIDPGGDVEDILNLIAMMSLKVVQIFITHGHFDHCLAAAQLAEATNAMVYIHEADKELLEKLAVQCKLFGAMPPRKELAPDVIQTFTDGFKVGVLEGRVIHTPGHSPGSSCFYFQKIALLASGDTLFRMSIGRSDLMGGDPQALKKSIISSLYTLPQETQVIPGHGPYTTIGIEQIHNPFVKKSQKSCL